MDVIVDTDILSTFGKINKLSLLKKLFSRANFCISSRNEAELLRAKKLGYKFISKALKFKLEKLSLDKDGKLAFQKLNETNKSLSLADIETLILAKSRNLVILTNDISVQKEAGRQNIPYFNLPMILRELWKQGIFGKENVNKLILQIERTDNIVIVDKEAIFVD